MLDQLTSKAGFVPLKETQGTAENDREDSVREFLDQQRSGWGAKYAAVFEEIGLETAQDLKEATGEELDFFLIRLGPASADGLIKPR